MSGLFNADGKLFRFFDQVANCVILSLFWVAFSLPIITIGASTSALYYAMHNAVKLNAGHLIPTFWKGFKENFKKATILWVILLLIYAFLGADLYFSYILSGTDSFLPLITVLIIIFLAAVTFWSLHWFAYIVHVIDPVKIVLKNTLIMCTQNLGRAVVLFFLFAVCIAIFVFLPYSPFYIFIVPGAYMYFAHSIHMKIFSRYFEIKGVSDV